jgi:hypothetical protein
MLKILDEVEAVVKMFREKGCMVDVRVEFEQKDEMAFIRKTRPPRRVPRWARESTP